LINPNNLMPKKEEMKKHSLTIVKAESQFPFIGLRINYGVFVQSFEIEMKILAKIIPMKK